MKREDLELNTPKMKILDFANSVDPDVKGKDKSFPEPHSHGGSGGLETHRAHPSVFAPLSFLNLRKIPIHCWVANESFQSSGGKTLVRSHDLLVTFCTITTLLYPLHYGRCTMVPLQAWWHNAFFVI